MLTALSIERDGLVEAIFGAIRHHGCAVLANGLNQAVAWRCRRGGLALKTTVSRNRP